MPGMPVCRTRCQDHKGKWHDSEKAMAAHWGISYETYKGRKKLGYSLKQRLTLKTPAPGRASFEKVLDHLGNEFNTEQDMAAFYKISAGAFRHRKKRGWGLEKALTTPQRDSDKSILDHTGKQHENQKVMALAWGITYPMYRARVKAGWDLKTILETGVAGVTRSIKVVGEDGVTYASLSDLANAYNMSLAATARRYKKGQRLIPLKVKDHLGNEFNTIQEMVEFHGISRPKYNKNIRDGLSLEDALTYWSRKYTDYLGNTFPNLEAAAKHYGLSSAAICGRRKRGWTERECFITPLGKGVNYLERKPINDNSLNSLVMIHEFSHTVVWTKERVFRCTIVVSGERRYFTEQQVKNFKGV